MISEWNSGKIEQLARVRSGYAFKGSQWMDEGVPVVKIGNVKRGRLDLKGCSFVTEADATSSGFLLSNGDILIGLTGYVGEVAKVRGFDTLVLNQRVGKFFPSEYCDPDFLFFLVANDEFRQRVEAASHGSAQANVSPTAIENLEVAYPELPEQRAIAHILGALDDKIDLNRRMNATLEEMARALFKNWFVDFGPTRAKMEGRAPYLASDIWSLFPDAFDEDGKPEGWEVGNVGDLIELLDSKRVPLSSREREKRKGPYPYHGATSVMDHVDNYLFDDVLLLLGEDGSVAQADGRPYTQYVWGKIWVNNHAHVIKGSGVSVEQLKCFFDMVDIAPFVTGAVQPKLNQANLKRVPFTKGSKQLHHAFDKIIAPWFSRIRQNAHESRTLTALRDTLLPKLMSGEVRVKDAEKRAGEVI